MASHEQLLLPDPQRRMLLLPETVRGVDNKDGDRKMEPTAGCECVKIAWWMYASERSQVQQPADVASGPGWQVQLLQSGHVNVRVPGMDAELWTKQQVLQLCCWIGVEITLQATPDGFHATLLWRDSRAPLGSIETTVPCEAPTVMEWFKQQEEWVCWGRSETGSSSAALVLLSAFACHCGAGAASVQLGAAPVWPTSTGAGPPERVDPIVHLSELGSGPVQTWIKPVALPTWWCQRFDQRTGPISLVCHDCGATVYKQDHHYMSIAADNCYRPTYWQHVDIFVYFSHATITIPPPGWITAAHVNGVRILGTFIVEWEAGTAQLAMLLSNPQQVCKHLVALAVEHGFDGWLLNIESNMPTGMSTAALVEWVASLRSAISAATPGGLVIWYDSLTVEGNLQWQYCLNAQNRAFFDACDGIFVDYHWTADCPARSAVEAGDRAGDVLMGIDAFGRGSFGGGRWDCSVAAAAAVAGRTSVALFAPAWTYEAQDGVRGHDYFQHKEDRFWRKAHSELDNLLVNPDSVAAPWVFHTPGCDGWQTCVEDDKQCRRPDAAAAEVVASHKWCSRQQIVDLFEHLPQHETTVRLLVQVWARGTPPNVRDTFRLQVQVRRDPLDETSNAAEFDTGVVTLDVAWQCFQHEFALPVSTLREARFLVWEDGGQDAECWQGHFGARIAGATCTLETTTPAVGLSAHLGLRPTICSLPFCTWFCDGQGSSVWRDGAQLSREPWFNLAAQTSLPECLYSDQMSWCEAYHRVRRRLCYDDAFQGGSSLLVEGVPGESCASLPMFHVAGEARPECVVRIVWQAPGCDVMPVAHPPSRVVLDHTVTLSGGWRCSTWRIDTPPPAAPWTVGLSIRAADAATSEKRLLMARIGLMALFAGESEPSRNDDTVQVAVARVSWATAAAKRPTPQVSWTWGVAAASARGSEGPASIWDVENDRGVWIARVIGPAFVFEVPTGAIVPGCFRAVQWCAPTMGDLPRCTVLLQMPERLV